LAWLVPPMAGREARPIEPTPVRTASPTKRRRARVLSKSSACSYRLGVS